MQTQIVIALETTRWVGGEQRYYSRTITAAAVPRDGDMIFFGGDAPSFTVGAIRWEARGGVFSPVICEDDEYIENIGTLDEMERQLLNCGWEVECESIPQ